MDRLRLLGDRRAPALDLLGLAPVIACVSGPPGSGKTFYAVRKVTRALEEGKVVAGNVELAPDWEGRLSRRNWVHYVRWGARRKFRREAAHRYHFTEDLEELTSLRLRGKSHQEGRGLMVLDEAHNWMNARSWSASDRQAIVRFFSQHRKIGWDVLLIAQHPEMIDKQVRNLCEYNVHLRNLKKARWAGIPIFPVNLFLAVWLWHAANRVVVKREVFPLSWRKDLYDTAATSHGLSSGLEGTCTGGVWLPSPPEARTAAPPDARTRATEELAAARPPERLPARRPGEGDEVFHQGVDDEAAQEAGEPEAWPVQADYGAPE